MNTNSRTNTSTAIATLIALTLAACGSDSDATSASAERSAPVASATEGNVRGTSSATTPETSVTEAPTTVDDVTMADFQAGVAARCDADLETLAAMQQFGGTIESANAQISLLRQLSAQNASLAPLEAPTELSDRLAEAEEFGRSADATLSAAEEAAAAGDVATAEENIGKHISTLAAIAVRYALMGATCWPADADHAANADLNTPVDGDPGQIGAGFGSVWVSDSADGTVVRIDPESGEILARIAVGEGPLKLQPADGKIWVRTQDAFVRIDPETNEVDATLSKAEIGPAANRNWALDGTMWICDGQQLHRYDPTTIEPVAVIDIDIPCEYVYATDDLVVAWTYNDDPSLRVDPATVMIDPATNQVLATIPLPNDVVFPAVFQDRVFFAGLDTPTAVVIDRATWTISSTPDLGRATGKGGIVSDGELIFVPTGDGDISDVLVVDANTYEVTDVIEPIDVNHVALLDGSLWLTDGRLGVVQRFDLES